METLQLAKQELLIIIVLLVQPLIFVPQQPVAIVRLVLLAQEILVMVHHSFLCLPSMELLIS